MYKTTNDRISGFYLYMGGAMYNKIYKCKLCNKIMLEEVCGETDQTISIKLINYYIEEKRVHYCSDDKMGILEIIGIKKV